MKAIQIVAYGDAAEGLELRDVPEPSPPGPGEALVAVEYAPINVNDLMVVWGIYSWKPTPPETMGNEGAGIVSEVGPDVSGVKVGDRVVLPFMSRTWRERLVVPADQLVVVPPEADPRQASMLAINPVTASLLLTDFVDLEPGDAVAYNAATSGLGQWLAALAARRGLRTIGLVRRREDVSKVLAGGCQTVVVDDEDVTSVRARLGDARIRLALDGVAGPASGRLAQLLGHGGKLVTYGAASRQPMELPPGLLIFNDVSVAGFYEGLPHNASRVVATMRELVHLITPDGVRQPVAATYPAERFKEAVARAVRRERVLLAFGGAP